MIKSEKTITIKNPPQKVVDFINRMIAQKKEREKEILSRKPDFEINL